MFGWEKSEEIGGDLSIETIIANRREWEVSQDEFESEKDCEWQAALAEGDTSFLMEPDGIEWLKSLVYRYWVDRQEIFLLKDRIEATLQGSQN